MWSDREIDHIDRIKTDNRIGPDDVTNNLRLATSHQQKVNTKNRSESVENSMPDYKCCYPASGEGCGEQVNIEIAGAMIIGFVLGYAVRSFVSYRRHQRAMGSGRRRAALWR
jgi:hypothetical protein